jgi:3-deoxy-D-manno-octulosonate 8-phosphate phosphatase (KDO 8-P phosphatase)
MKKKLANIRLLLLDVDGVLTDGSITYSDSGEQIKTFNSRDGLGLRLLMDAGIDAGIITGRRSEALNHRCANLGITLLFDNIKDKSKALNEIVAHTKIMPEQIAFAGDDLVDIPVMKRVGISFAVADACTETRECCDIVTEHRGGHGAVREICELILKAKGLWTNILNKFSS